MVVVAVADALGVESRFLIALGIAGTGRWGGHPLQRHDGCLLLVCFASADVFARKAAIVKSLAVFGLDSMPGSNLAPGCLEFTPRLDELFPQYRPNPNIRGSADISYAIPRVHRLATGYHHTAAFGNDGLGTVQISPTGPAELLVLDSVIIPVSD